MGGLALLVLVLSGKKRHVIAVQHFTIYEKFIMVPCMKNACAYQKFGENSQKIISIGTTAEYNRVKHSVYVLGYNIRDTILGIHYWGYNAGYKIH